MTVTSEPRPRRRHRKPGPSMLFYSSALAQHEADAALSIWVVSNYTDPVAMLYLSRHGLQWRTAKMPAPQPMPDADQAIEIFRDFLGEVAEFRAAIPHVIEGPFVLERPDDLVGLKLSAASAEILDQLRQDMGEAWESE